MDETPPKKRGPRPKADGEKRKSYTLTLDPAEIARLEEKAAAEKLSPSRFIVKKLKL